MKSYLLLALFLLIGHWVEAQDYTFSKISQEPIARTKTPTIEPVLKENGDTSFTVYANCSVPMSLYFVNGSQYNPIFNPNPTGLYLNGQHFLFYCDVDKAFKQSVSTILDVYEFTYLSRNYLCTFTLREDNANSRYKCYNLFDITNPAKIFQTSFSSIHQGEDSFGDFNMDGAIDFVRTQAAKVPPGADKKKTKASPDTYLITAYTFGEGKIRQLVTQGGMPHYIFAKADENIDNFKVLQHDWMIPLKDTSGTVIEVKNYHGDKTELFEVSTNDLYNLSGVKVDKNRWSVLLGAFDDEGGAQNLCDEMKKHELGDLFIMFDQYNGDIKWQVLLGNFSTKEQAEQIKNRLIRYGFTNIQLRDFRSNY